MAKISHVNRLSRWLTTWMLGTCAAALPLQAFADEPSEPQAAASSQQSQRPAKAHPDLSGHQRVGKASIYAKRFAGKKMADGNKMDPHGDNAASKTLPLGTKAKVTNLETGQSANITIQDRGPHVKGRIVDLSPATAKQIGIHHRKGVAMVQVDPIAVPLPDASVKPGVAAMDAPADSR